MSDSGFYHRDTEEDQKASASSEDLQNSERSFNNGNGSQAGEQETASIDRGGLYRAESGSGLASKGLMAAASLTPAGKALKFASKHKKGIGIGGGGLIGFIVSLVFFFGFLASYELITIEKDMLRYEDKAVSYVVKKAANSIISRIYCRGLSGTTATLTGCSNSNADEKIANQDGTENEAEKLAQDQDPMTAEIDAFKFTDPQVQKSLSNQGIKVNDEGNQISFEDENTGQLITYGDLETPEMIARFQAAIPDFDIGQLKAYRSLLTVDEGANWNPIPSPEDPKPENDIEDDINGTATNEAEQLADAQVEDGQAPKNEPNAQAASEALTAAEDNTIINTADQAIASGDSEAVVLQKTEAAAEPELADSLTVASIVSTLCSIDKAATTASKDRIPTILAFLVRHSSTLLGFADEMKVPGKLSGKQISKVTSLFNGNPTIKTSTKSKVPDQTLKDASLPFSSSAAWQRIEGKPVNSDKSSPGYNPDFSSSLLPVQNAGSYIVRDINNILSITGGKFLCSLLNNSIFGHIFMVVGALATATIDFASLGAAQILIGGAVVGTQQVAQHIIIPDIVKYFTPVAMDGLENSVQWMNNADAGTNIANNMYMQRLGGVPLTSTQSATLYSKGTQLANIEESNKSFINRTFSFSNPESLVSKLAVNLPLSRMGIINSMFSDIIKAPVLLAHSFADLIDARAFAAQTTDPGAPYDITQYGFTTNDITKYDPVNNEYYLFHTVVPYQNNSKTLIQLLGNPNNYPYGSYDNNQNDLLHCFALSPYGQNGQMSSSLLWQQQSGQSAPDPICGTMGNLSTDIPVQPIQASNVASNVICNGMGYGTNNQNCNSTVTNFINQNDIITRYRQYILDDEVTNFISDFQSTAS
jgi:hypothetical protein